MFTTYDIEKIKALSVEDVACRLGLPVSRHKALCPFHNDRHPSLTFDLRRNRYRCFVCNASGNPVDLVMKSQGWNFREACQWMAKEFGVVTSDDFSFFTLRQPTHAALPSSQAAAPPPPVDTRHLETLMSHPHISQEARRFLYDERGIAPRVVELTGLSSISQPTPMSGNPNEPWFNSPSLLIPYRNIDGKLLSVQARYLGTGKQPRFQFPRGSTPSIFGMQLLPTIGYGDELWITEGVTDCLAMMSSGKQAIAIPSATLLKSKDASLLSTWVDALHLQLHMYPDNDAPGVKLFLELQKHFPTLQHHLLPSRFKDYGDFWIEMKNGSPCP